MKKVAILMSYFNGAKYLDEQIKSLQLLEKVDLEITIFIRNDGSTDHVSNEILRELEKKHSNINVIEDLNVGVQRSFYKLLKVVDGYDYYAFCDQDDYWYKDKICDALRYIGDSSVPALYCSSYDLVDDSLQLINDKRRIGVSSSFENAVVKNFCTGCTCVINEALREKLLDAYFNEDIPMHDWWFLLVAYITGYVFYDNKAQIMYRQHASNVVGGMDTFWLKFKRYFSYLMKNNTTRFKLAESLLYCSKLEGGNKDIKKIEFLELFVESKKSILKRFQLLSKYNFTHSGLFERISVYVVIILGRY